MKIQQIIENKLLQQFQPIHLEVINESHMHNVPEGSESHFKVVIVAEAFVKQPLLQRHRMVNETLSGVFEQIHALALHVYTPEEWEKESDIPDSPRCRGGSRHDSK